MNTENAIAVIDDIQPAPDYSAAERYLARLSHTGAAGMRSSLGLATRLMGFANLSDVPWNHFTAGKLEQLARVATETPTERGTPRAPASVTALVNAVKGACKVSWKDHKMSTDAWERIREVKPPAGSRLPAGRNIGTGEKTQLLRSAAGDDGPAGPRDAAIMAMFMGTGIRRAELASMEIDDIDLASGRAVILGKGNKEREAFLAPGSMAALFDWLEIRGRTPGPLFCPIRKGGILATDRHLALSAVSYIIEHRRMLAGVAHLTPHDFRRTLAGDMLDAGDDLSTVSEALGHADPKTTKRYDRRGSRTRQAAAAKIDVPYKSRARSQSRMELG